MRYILMIGVLCVGLLGCRLPPDRDPMKPLQEDGARFSYGELLSRLHSQANAAMDAFFVDSWKDLDEAAQGIDQTARFLPKATDPPQHLKINLEKACGNLQKEANQLAEAARKNNPDSATEALQRITMQIRQLKAKE